MRTVGRTHRLAGYEAALAEHSIDLDRELIWDAGLDRNSYGDADALNLGRQGVQLLLSRPNPPTAIFALNDMIAFGAYAGARDMGLSVPRDLSVVGIDDLTLAEVVDPGLTTVRQPIEQIAEFAVNSVIGRLNGATAEPAGQHELLRPQLILRASTAEVATTQSQAT